MRAPGWTGMETSGGSRSLKMSSNRSCWRFFFFGGEVSKRFILFPWSIFAYWVLISAATNALCFLSRTDSAPLGCGGLGWWAVQCISFGHLPQGLRPLLVFKGRYQRGGRDGPITLLWCLRQPWVGQFGAFEGPNLGSLVAFRLASRMRHEDGWIRWIAWQKWVQMDWLDWLLVDSFWKNLDFSQLVENRFDDFLIQTLLRKSFEKLPDKHWDHDLQLGGSNCCYFSREPFFGCAARFWALAGWWAHSGHRLCYFFRLHLLLATHPGISAYKFDPFVKLLELVRLDTLGLLLTSNVMTLAERAGWWQKARNGTCSEECFCKPHLMFVDTWLNYAELELIVLNHTICIYLWDWRAQYGSIISIILSLQDKLCIEQKDAREKTKGTLGVG